MITTLFYASSTLVSPGTCNNMTRGNSCCKHAEFINVWYDYVRYVYGPKEHLFIIDNGSPYVFKEYFRKSDKVEYLDVDQYNYDPNVYIHVKRFDDSLTHGGGVVRGFHEGFKFAIKNDLDFYFAEADSLSIVNLKKELEGYSVVTSNVINGPNGAIDMSNSAIRLGLLRDHVTKVPEVYGSGTLTVFESLDQSIRRYGVCQDTHNLQYYGIIENGPYINYHKDYEIKKIDGNWIHDCNPSTLMNFINTTNQLVKSDDAIKYLERL